MHSTIQNVFVSDFLFFYLSSGTVLIVLVLLAHEFPFSG